MCTKIYTTALTTYQVQTIKNSIKLSRKMAIFEFLASNGNVSLTLDYECRKVALVEDQNHFSYLVTFHEDIYNDTSCVERSFEKKKYTVWNHTEFCITTFQGKMCSII